MSSPCSRVTFAALVSARLLAAEPVADVAQMPRVPATPPHLAAATFTTRPGFSARLAASEPLVQSPVAMAFDEAGAAFVVEMRDYSERRSERLGRIRRLRDTDLDGTMDVAEILADDLPWPTAIACWDGGVFVGATPDIWYLKDTDGDGRADVREIVFTGFGADDGAVNPKKLNVQALLNSFQWGADQRIHGATSMSSGRVRRADTPFVRAWLERAGIKASNMPAAVSLRGRDFAFDPRTLELGPVSGGGQHGMTFDDSGRKFVCSNSDHLQQIVYEDLGVDTEPGQPLPSTRLSIAADGPSAPVFRRSPDEPWRVLRTRWRVAGLVEGPVEGGGRPSGYFTGATGVTVHRGDAYPPGIAGSVFIADCGSNLIHRKRLHPQPDGLVLIGERAADESQSEFLASTDNWFRPVQFVNAPDGCLWVVDMYRETIEHPWSLPDGIKRHLDLNSGFDRGRLWRLEPDGFDRVAATRRIRGLATASTEELVRLLGHPNAWHRDTAARLLHTRRDPAARQPMERLLGSANLPVGRVLALHRLNNGGWLMPALLNRAFKDAHADVRAAAVELAFRMGLTSHKTLLELARDPAPIVRLAVARHASQSSPASRAELVSTLLQQGPDLVRDLALPATRGMERDVWNTLRRSSPDQLVALARRIGARHDTAVLDAILSEIPTISPRSRQFSIAAALGDGLAPDQPLRLADTGHRLASLWAEAARYATNRALSRIRTAAVPGVAAASIDLNPDDPAARLAALRLLAHANEADALPLLIGRLHSEPDDIREAALEALARLRGPAWANAVAGALSTAGTPRGRLLRQLIRRPEGRVALLDALDRDWVRPADFDADLVRTMRASPVAGRAADIRRWFGEASSDRRGVIDRFLPTLGLRGDAGRGARQFEQRCAACHRLRNLGNALGPDLASVASNGPEKLLVGILDPNREVSPNFTAWRAVTRDGEETTGILAREDGGNVVLRQAGGVEVALARSALRSLENTGRSLMPEGLEEGLDPQSLADLLAHLSAP